MQRVRRWIGSKLVLPRRRRSDAGRVAVVLGAGTMVALILGATMGARPVRSRLQAVPAGLGRASGLFGRLIRSARRAAADGSSVALSDGDAGNGVRPKAPAAKSTVGDGEQALTRV
jgi:hypothetical protein